MKRGIYILTILFMIMSCTKKDKITIEDLRQQEIDRRVKQFMVNKKTECYNNTMDQAIHIADSLLKINAVKYVQDSLRRPDLPTKPELILKPAPRDSIKPRPFIQPPAKDNINSRSFVEKDTAQ